MACDMDSTRAENLGIRNRSSVNAAPDWTTISRPCHTWGRRASIAAAQPYHEWNELVCTTSTSKRCSSQASRATVTGHRSAYSTQSRARWLREIRRIGTTCTSTPAASNSGRSGGSAGTMTWQSNSGRGRLRSIRSSA